MRRLSFVSSTFQLGLAVSQRCGTVEVTALFPMRKILGRGKVSLEIAANVEAGEKATISVRWDAGDAAREGEPPLMVLDTRDAEKKHLDSAISASLHAAVLRARELAKEEAIAKNSRLQHCIAAAVGLEPTSRVTVPGDAAPMAPAAAVSAPSGRGFGASEVAEDDEIVSNTERADPDVAALTSFGVVPPSLLVTGGLEGQLMLHLAKLCKEHKFAAPLTWKVSVSRIDQVVVQLRQGDEVIADGSGGLLFAYRTALEGFSGFLYKARSISRPPFDFLSRAKAIPSPPNSEIPLEWMNFLIQVVKVHHGAHAAGRVTTETTSSDDGNVVTNVLFEGLTKDHFTRVVLGCGVSVNPHKAAVDAIKDAIQNSFPAVGLVILRSEMVKPIAPNPVVLAKQESTKGGAASGGKTQYSAVERQKHIDTVNKEDASRSPPPVPSVALRVQQAVDRLLAERYGVRVTLQVTGSGKPTHALRMLSGEAPPELLKALRRQETFAPIVSAATLYHRLLRWLVDQQPDAPSEQLLSMAPPSLELPNDELKFLRLFDLTYRLNDEERIQLRTLQQAGDAFIVAVVFGEHVIGAAQGRSLSAQVNAFRNAGAMLFPKMRWSGTSESPTLPRDFLSASVLRDIPDPGLYLVRHVKEDMASGNTDISIDARLDCVLRELLSMKSLKVFAGCFASPEVSDTAVQGRPSPDLWKVQIIASREGKTITTISSNASPYTALRAAQTAMSSHVNGGVTMFEGAVREMTSKHVEHLQQWTPAHIASAVFKKVHGSELLFTTTEVKDGFKTEVTARVGRQQAILCAGVAQSKKASHNNAAIAVLSTRTEYQGMTTVVLSPTGITASKPQAATMPVPSAAKAKVDLVTVLQEAMESDTKPKVLRIEKGAISGGHFVRLYAIPFSAGKALNLLGERQIAFQKNVEADKALKQACYRVLEEHYKSVLATVVGEHPDLLENFL